MNKLECILDCGHSIRATIGTSTAKVDSPAYCRFDGWQNVVTVYNYEWRMICADCQTGRWTGQNEREAMRAARTHTYLRRHYRTFVVYDAITRSGGTPRKVLLKRMLTPASAPCDDGSTTPDEPAPF